MIEVSILRYEWSTLWRREMTSLLPIILLAENHSSKSSEEANISGRRKFSNAHSSCRLFCSGVPVSSSRFFVLNWRTNSDSCKAFIHNVTGHLHSQNLEQRSLSRDGRGETRIMRSKRVFMVLTVIFTVSHNSVFSSSLLLFLDLFKLEECVLSKLHHVHGTYRELSAMLLARSDVF